MTDAKNDIVKLNYKATKPPPYSLNIDDLKGLFKLLQEINEEEANEQLSKLKKSPEQSGPDFEKFKKDLIELYKINIQIYCTDGTAYISRNESIFDTAQFSSTIKKIVFDNVMEYRIRFGYNPPYLIHVEFDFTKSSILDFSYSPSDSTFNSSMIELSGGRDTWLAGAHQRIKNFLRDKRRRIGWLHKTNVYDFFLWIIFLPLMLFNLFKVMSRYSFIFSNVPSSYQTALYIYSFLFSIFLARIVFNYARWLFPIMELDAEPKRKDLSHRVFFGIIILSIISSAIYDLIKLLIGF
jgi:hypothetical protein